MVRDQSSTDHGLRTTDYGPKTTSCQCGNESLHWPERSRRLGKTRVAGRAAPATLKKEIGVDDPKIIDISYEDFRSQTPLNAEVTIDGARAIIAQIAKPVQSHALGDYIDTRPGDALKASGFYAEMDRKYARK